MNTTKLLLELMDIELSLLICRAKLTLCNEESDLDSASDAYEMAFDCGMRYEDAIYLYNRLDYSDMALDLIASIKQIYRSSSSFLISGFEGGRCDVCIGNMDI